MVNPRTYTACSAVCAAAVIYHAYVTRRQFYPAVVYLSRSKISLLFLLNMGLVLLCCVWQSLVIVFLCDLRESEVERLNEHVWREVMEVLFAMTVFRDEIETYSLFLVTLLLFMKSHHWLAQKRVEYFETTPGVLTFSHVRLCTFLALLLTLDSLFFYNSVSHLLMTREASMSLLFAFEYSILMLKTVSTSVKYGLHMVETYMEGRFRNKAVYLFYLELVQDLLHLSLYLLFFLVIFMHYGLPLHLVRELYETFRNFKNRIFDFFRYRRLTYNMNERFANASRDDLTRDATCIVCREDMVDAKKLPCGHLFHLQCLRQWLERQNTCPTCRGPVLGAENSTLPNEEFLEENEQEDEGESDDMREDIPESFDNHLPRSNVLFEDSRPELHAAASRAAAAYQTSFVFPVLSLNQFAWYRYSALVYGQQLVELQQKLNSTSLSGGVGQGYKVLPQVRTQQTTNINNPCETGLTKMDGSYEHFGQRAIYPWYGFVFPLSPNTNHTHAEELPHASSQNHVTIRTRSGADIKYLPREFTEMYIQLHQQSLTRDYVDTETTKLHDLSSVGKFEPACVRSYIRSREQTGDICVSRPHTDQGKSVQLISNNPLYNSSFCSSSSSTETEEVTTDTVEKS